MNISDLDGTRRDAKTELATLKTSIDIAVCFNLFKKLGFTADDIDDMRKSVIEGTPQIKEVYTRLKTEIQAAEFYEKNPEERLKQMLKEKMQGR